MTAPGVPGDALASEVVAALRVHSWVERLVECSCGWEPSFGCPDRGEARREHNAHLESITAALVRAHLAATGGAERGLRAAVEALADEWDDGDPYGDGYYSRRVRELLAIDAAPTAEETS